MERLILASVPYVNAEPLTWGFEHGPLRATHELRRVPPAEIADLLRAGRADVGLVPAIEYPRLEGAEMVPGLAIASRERARSVLVVSRVPFDRVTRVAVDRNSRTSVALLRVLLAHRGRHDVVLTPQAPALRDMLRDNDAALLIGDAALTCDAGGLAITDLAAEWHARTRLPFVFAFWVARPGLRLPGGAGPFAASCRTGTEAIPAIAAAAAARLGLAAGSIEDYLKSNIHYHAGAGEARALELFYRQAEEIGILPGPGPIRLRAFADREGAMAGRSEP